MSSSPAKSLIGFLAPWNASPTTSSGKGGVYEATLSFRPCGCFLEEVSLHNHEKAYKTVKATKLGEKTIIHLAGAQPGEKLSYLVPSSDLIYSSLMVYIRKKAKK